MRLFKKFCFCLIFSYVITGYQNNVFSHSAEKLTPNEIYNYMNLVGKWQWDNLRKEGWKNDKKDWTNGAMYAGMMEWAKVSNSPAAYQNLLQVATENNWKIGNIRRFADDYCVGQKYAQLYKIDNNPIYIQDFKQLADSLTILPHNESLLWENEIYYREWAWCDALFMGPPALAYLSDALGDDKYINTASRLWWKTSDYLYDTKEKLFFRDSRYFDKKEKNGKKVFWSRGNGWVLGGLVRMLGVMPLSHPDRPRFIKQYKEMANRIAKLQQPDGSWHASLLDPESYPVKETSGTGFFCYALAWGINNGILESKKFSPVARKAWNCLVSSVHPDGKLGFVQAQGRDPQKVTYDDTEVYGTGAFLLAGYEMLILSLPDKKIIVKSTKSSLEQINYQVDIDGWKSLEKSKESKYVVINALTNQQVAATVIYDRKKKPKSLEFTSTIFPGSEQYFIIKNL